ncbi:MAG: hypothetical protein CMN76_08195 [Spirochaetaceae bacterium]|nr:hypothetical protein [Spirochaetaceae bacterium]
MLGKWPKPLCGFLLAYQLAATSLAASPARSSAEPDFHFGFSTSLEGLHSFSGDSSQDFNYGDSSRWLLAELDTRAYSPQGAALIYGLDASVIANLGSATMKRPAIPAKSPDPHLQEIERPAPGLAEPKKEAQSADRGGRFHLSARQLYIGLSQRIRDIFSQPGSSQLTLALGRFPWRKNNIDRLMAHPGFFAGLHLVWQTANSGKAVFSPGYLLDSPVGIRKPFESPALAYDRQRENIAGSSLDSSRYGTAAYYIYGNRWQFGMGFRQHTMRKEARLYLPGNLQYLHAFLGYQGRRFRVGLGYSRVTGELQIPRQTSAEERKARLDEDSFEPMPRTGGDRNQQSIPVAGAELHGNVAYARPRWGLALDFFLPESGYQSDSSRRDSFEAGYVHPGNPPYSMPLTAFYGFASGFRPCTSRRCPDLYSPSGALFAKARFSVYFKWSGYRTAMALLYSGARVQTGNGLKNSAPDPDSPDYLEFQIRIQKRWKFSRTAQMEIQYGRIYIRKTRPSRAFGDYLRFGLSLNFADVRKVHDGKPESSS